MSDNKTVKTTLTPMAYVKAIEHPVRRADADVLLPWFRKLTGLPAVMWGDSIVGYGRYHYQYESGRQGDYLITGFSARKSALSIYIMPGYRDMGAYLDQLGKHKIGKSCLYINKLADIDMNVLAEMVLDGVHHMQANYPTWKK